MNDALKTDGTVKSFRTLHKRFGTMYYFATQFFPKDLADATSTLYAFVRLPDEMVDSAGHLTIAQRRASLVHWREEWHKALATGISEEPVLTANVRLFEQYKIPRAYAEAFFDAMLQDTEKERYETYKDLQDYMYGSAVVVGYMMTHLIGYQKEEAFPYAAALGEAFQLTNFLRDIDEDYQERQRIYMPLDELRAHGSSEDDIIHRRATPEFRSFVKFQATRARELYRKADIGIEMLDPRGRSAVRIASALYESILDTLEEWDWDVFRGRAHVPTLRKLALTSKVLWKNAW